MRPLKIPWPKPEETQFRRKRNPPPRVTKLLIASLSVGLIFMALLVIVFVPRYLENLNPPPSTLLDLALNTTSGTRRIEVTFALCDLDLSKLNATFYRDNVTVASLSAGLAGGTSTLAFADANQDRKIDVGDFFTVRVRVQGDYRLEAW